MTLTNLLGINAEAIKGKWLFAIGFIEKLWIQAGKPTEPIELRNFLDSALKRCKAGGVPYLKIYLLRLGQLNRGEWRPRIQTPTEPADPGACPRCHGRGYTGMIDAFTQKDCRECLGTGRRLPARK